MGTVEPFRSRWSRRVKTIPMMLGATLLGLATLPVLIPLLVVADLLRLRWRLPSVRVYLFVLQYGVNDSFEILAAPVLWVVAGFGTGLAGEASIRRHERIQRWSVDVLARRAERLLGVRIEIAPADLDRLGPGPVIVLCRHVNLLDASLPALVYQRLGFRVRGVIMAELLADPGFDLLYGRLGSVFVTRDHDPEARRAVARLADDLDGDTAAVIFPEGRLFRADVLARALARLAQTDPGRAERLARLRHHLPPRPGGVMSLLEGAPHADVVLLTHTGLDEFPSFAALARGVPLRRPVRVVVRRFAASAVPVDWADRVRWLDDAWLAADETVAAAVAAADRLDG
jgi:1-acyl-sn-glycerol-3-phosphate acyltransferase